MAEPFNFNFNLDFSGIDWANLVMNPTPIAAQESGTIGARSIVAQNQPVKTESQPTATVAASPASFRAKEEADKKATPTSAPTPVSAPAPASPASVRAKEETDKTKAVETSTKETAESPVLTNTSAVANRFTSASITAQTREERMDELQRTREQRMASEAMKRAQSDPMANYAVRPDAPEADDNFIYYYSWIGGVNTGNWKLYRAPNTPENMAKYGSRAIGGDTQATASSAVGANALTVQPKPVLDKDGNVTGYTVNGVSSTDIFGDPNKKTNDGIITDGTGDKNNPFTVNGKPFTGTMNGKKYVDGIIEASDDGTTSDKVSTSTDILKSMLRGLGYPTKLIDSSTDFLQRLLKEGLDYDNAVSIFLNSKDYTFKDGVKVQSPFYSEYGIYNEGLLIPKTPDELFNAVEGYKDVVAKYKLNTKFASTDSIKKYIKNSKTVADLDADANMARLKGITADPYYLQALQVQGFIKSGADLTDFFLDPDIGKEQLETNKATAALTSEVLRRARTNPQAAGISVDTERLKSLSANLQAKGYTAAGVGQQAETAYGVISQQLPQLSMLSGAFEKGPTNEAQRSVELQKELESEQLLGMASERRKRLEQQNINIFSGASGRGLLARPRYGAI
jgi:hypothetical protein